VLKFGTVGSCGVVSRIRESLVGVRGHSMYACGRMLLHLLIALLDCSVEANVYPWFIP
jgi:hypothetical protein